MKKMFFLLGFVLCLSFTASAQTYLEQAEAVEALKKVLASGENQISLTQQVGDEASKDAVMLSVVKDAAVRGYVGMVSTDGNTEETLNAFFARPMFTSERVKPEIVADAKAYLVGIVTKS